MRTSGKKRQRGLPVYCNWKSEGIWYPSVIIRILTSNKFDIQFNAGDEIERSVPRKNIRFESSKLAVGQVVLGNWHGKGTYFKGVIVKVRGVDSYDIAFDDGDFEENMRRSMIAEIDPEALSRFSSSNPNNAGPQNAQEVEATSSKQVEIALSKEIEVSSGKEAETTLLEKTNVEAEPSSEGGGASPPKEKEVVPPEIKSIRTSVSPQTKRRIRQRYAPATGSDPSSSEDEGDDEAYKPGFRSPLRSKDVRITREASKALSNMTTPREEFPKGKTAMIPANKMITSIAMPEKTKQDGTTPLQSRGAPHSQVKPVKEKKRVREKPFPRPAEKHRNKRTKKEASLQNAEPSSKVDPKLKFLQQLHQTTEKISTETPQSMSRPEMIKYLIALRDSNIKLANITKAQEAELAALEQRRNVAILQNVHLTIKVSGTYSTDIDINRRN